MPAISDIDTNLVCMFMLSILMHGVPINRNDPWYNAMKSDITAAKKKGIGLKDST